MKRYLPFLIIGAVLAGVAIIVVVLTRTSNSTTSNSTTSQPNSNAYFTYTAPPGALPAHAIGPENAAVTLEEFGDYQCPPCGIMFPEVKKIEAEYGDKIRFIFRQNPLPQIHKFAITAAHAAEAAGMQGRFWAMHDKLYENQKVWEKADDPRATFIEYARSIGIDVDRFTKDLSSEEADNRLVEDHKRAAALGVTGTPTFFVNGRELKGNATTGVTADVIRSALNSALQSAQK
jgi:protein-disulfide isomerase